MLFVFLSKNNMLYKNDLPIIDNGTLFALTLLIAESNPDEMEIMKQIVVSVLKDNYILSIYQFDIPKWLKFH